LPALPGAEDLFRRSDHLGSRRVTIKTESGKTFIVEQRKYDIFINGYYTAYDKDNNLFESPFYAGEACTIITDKSLVDQYSPMMGGLPYPVCSLQSLALQAWTCPTSPTQRE
jgi:hypothetical protein